MHLPASVVQLLFAVQLPVCLYVGVRTARRTGRALLNWLVYGFLMAIVYPPGGAVIALAIFFVCPPVRRTGTETPT
jgi:hypothetical protein